jgi:spermidine/putrescine transport system permease protein
MRRHRLFLIPVALALVLVYLPLLGVVLFSFDKSSAPIMPIQQLTLSWYGTLWHDSDLHQALATTLKVGAITVVCVLCLATVGAFALRGKRFPGRGAYEAMIGLPFLLPEVVIGISLLTWMSVLKIDLSIRTIVLGHILFCLGAGFRVVAGRVETLPRSLEEAARDLGCGAFRTFVLVTFPAMRSALLIAGLLVFALSFDQTIITILLSGTENTLPTLLWAKLRIGVTPEVNALATVILLVSFVIAVPLGLKAGRNLTD